MTRKQGEALASDASEDVKHTLPRLLDEIYNRHRLCVFRLDTTFSAFVVDPTHEAM